MANNQKYSIVFGSVMRDTNTWSVKIRKKGYAGASTLKTGQKDPVSISWAGSDYFWKNSLVPSTCTIGFMATTELEYKEFFDAVWEDYQVVITDVDSGALIWIGYNEPGAYSEPYTDTPYAVSLTFTDGLTNLKNTEFKNGANLWTGQMHIIEVLRYCLNTIGANYTSGGQGPLSLMDIYNVYETNMVDGVASSALVQTYVDTSLYRVLKEKVEEGMSCYDVIDAILTSIGCHLYQANGLWYIVRPQEYSETVLTYRLFLPLEGNESNTATSSNGTLSHVINHIGAGSITTSDVVMTGKSGTLMVRPKIGRVTVTYRPNKRNFDSGAVTMNSQFYEDFDIDSTTSLPLFWSRSVNLDLVNCIGIQRLSTDRKGITYGTSTEKANRRGPQTLRNIDKKDVTKLPDNSHKFGTFFIKWFQTITGENMTKYISQTMSSLFVTTSDKFAVYHKWIQWGVVNGGGVSHHPYYITLTDLSGPTVYYLLEDGSWSTTDINNPTITTFIPSSQEKEHSYAFITDVFPFTGEADIEFRAAIPWHNTKGNQSDTYSQDISLLYKVGGTNTPIPETIFQKVVDSLFETYDIETFHGDGPETNSQCTFRLSTGVKTDTWHRFAVAESVGIETILMNDILIYKASSPKGWQGELSSIEKLVWPYSKIHFSETIPPATTQEFDFVPLSMEWNMAERTYNVNMDSVAQLSYSATDIETGGFSPAVEDVRVKDQGGDGNDKPIKVRQVNETLIKSRSFPG